VVLGVVILLPLALAAVGLLWTLAWLTARTTVYTITDRRLVMRVGIVLSVTFNLPYSRIETAGLRRHPDGTGDLTLQLTASDQIAYAHLWPHARPWRLRRTEPMLRSVPEAQTVAVILSQAMANAAGLPSPTVVAQPTQSAVRPAPTHSAQPWAAA
jgi:hypothetical protein